MFVFLPTVKRDRVKLSPWLEMKSSLESHHELSKEKFEIFLLQQFAHSVVKTPIFEFSIGLFEIIEQNSDKFETSVSVYMMELYCDQIQDLLATKQDAGTKYIVKKDKKGNIKKIF